jgi:endonuclease YncB( thermonuclease family)
MSLLLALTLTAGTPFTCYVTKVHDGDGPLWCRNGPKVRIAGVQAPDFESAEPCRQSRAGYVCSDSRARASQQIVERMVLHRQLNCVAIEPSYNRMVARCSLPGGRDLSCAVIAAGAAARWDTYWRRYRMGGC